MKKLLFALFFLPNILFASPDHKLPDQLTVAVGLVYQGETLNHLPVTNEVQSFFNLHPNTPDQKWVEVARTHQSTSDFIVLSKLTHSNSKVISLSFLIIDLATKKSAILEPSLTLPLGKRKEITLQHKQWSIRLSALVTE